MNSTLSSNPICTCCLLMIRKHFPKKFNVNSMHKFYFEILAVDLFIKPAWLCDMFAISGKEMDNILEALFQNDFLHNKPDVIEITGDILVINQKQFVKKIEKVIKSLECQSFCVQNPTFIVLKESRSSNKVDGDLKLKLKNVLQSLIFTIKSSKNVCFDAGDMTPTVFGIALGYPIVYIQENSISSSIPDTMNLYNIIGKVKMVNPQFVQCSVHKNTPKTLDITYQFSIPEEFKDKYLENVNLWLKKLKDQCKQSDFDVEILYNNATNCHVVL